MKANYTKPLLAVEVFSTSQPTARDCADNIPKDRLTFAEPGKCVWDLGGGTTMFTAEVNCTIDAGPIYCYNNPSDGNYVFRS